MAIVWSGQKPSGTTTVLEEIGISGVSSLGFITNSVELIVTPVGGGGPALTAITGSVIQPGWKGSIVFWGASDKFVTIKLYEWPDTLPNGVLVTFFISIDEHPV